MASRTRTDRPKRRTIRLTDQERQTLADTIRCGPPARNYLDLVLGEVRAPQTTGRAPSSDEEIAAGAALAGRQYFNSFLHAALALDMAALGQLAERLTTQDSGR